MDLDGVVGEAGGERVDVAGVEGVDDALGHGGLDGHGVSPMVRALTNGVREPVHLRRSIAHVGRSLDGLSSAVIPYRNELVVVHGDDLMQLVAIVASSVVTPSKTYHYPA